MISGEEVGGHGSGWGELGDHAGGGEGESLEKLASEEVTEEGQEEGICVDSRQVAGEEAAYQAAEARRQALVCSVKAEIARKQSERGKGWGHLILLVVSLVVFFQLGLLEANARLLVLIVAVLVVHEAGHYVGMRAFGYRNVQMFFVPMLGAAVRGRCYGVASWKRALVSLMGPLPGVGLGVVLTVAAGVTGSKLLLEMGMMFVIVNGLNLLPVFPLDGGQLLREVLFSRHATVELGFRVVGGLAIFVGAFLLRRAWILAAFGGLTAVLAIMAYGQARLAGDLRRRWQQAARARGWSGAAGGPPFGQRAPWKATRETTETLEAEDEVPVWAVGAILPRLQEQSGGDKAKVATLAQLTLDIWERVQLRPPAWWVSVLFLVGYLLSLAGVAAGVVVLGTVQTMLQGGG